jgi:hypothetical protein
VTAYRPQDQRRHQPGAVGRRRHPRASACASVPRWNGLTPTSSASSAHARPARDLQQSTTASAPFLPLGEEAVAIRRAALGGPDHYAIPPWISPLRRAAPGRRRGVRWPRVADRWWLPPLRRRPRRRRVRGRLRRSERRRPHRSSRDRASCRRRDAGVLGHQRLADGRRGAARVNRPRRAPRRRKRSSKAIV